ncbi:MAG: NhaD family Na+/H+ antiporter [Candidatus Endobugula sp.]|jgi:NhaD family Na+/H+ antiporter
MLTSITPRILFVLMTILASPFATASAGSVDMTSSTVGYICLVVFALAYVLVIGEEYLHLRKSKPVLLAAGIIWILIAMSYQGSEDSNHIIGDALRHNLLEYAELLLFLLVAMTYIAALEERRLFDALRVWLVSKGLSFRQLFWTTGILAFFISPIADNLTTALVMCAVILAVGGNDTKFVSASCVNIVVAANAGGAFSPFGDITTLMVWQKGMVEFTQFFSLFLPSVVNFLIPAVIMSLFISKEQPVSDGETVELKRGAKRIVLLFLATVATAILCHTFLHLPPVFGMMTGLAYLQFFGFFLKKTLPKSLEKKRLASSDNPEKLSQLSQVAPFDVFSHVQRAEWDTLMFFYGVVMCVGGLGFLGYLGLVSEVMYTQWSPLYANISVGVLSAIVDNIPVMFAVLTMLPEMDTGQWLLVTLTAGVGGSLLSVGSAAGVALMGQAPGKYTFFSHLKWTPVIALGYAASILMHMWINGALFTNVPV